MDDFIIIRDLILDSHHSIKVFSVTPDGSSDANPMALKLLAVPVLVK